MLFNSQLLKFFLPPDWLSVRHLHFSLQTPLLENNLSFLYIIFFGLSPGRIGHLLF